MENPILTAARRLHAAGLSIIPIRADQSKAPTLAWKAFQERRMTEHEVGVSWGTPQPLGIAIVCGAISSNTECLDFDSPDAFNRWCELTAPGLDTRPELVVTETPGPGKQVWYRMETAPPGNHVLARAVGEDGKPVVLVETRGTGGYALVPPSPAACHPNGQSYRMLFGDLAKLPLWSPSERERMHAAARSLNTWVEPQASVKARHCIEYPDDRYRLQARVGDRYNAEGDHAELLQKHGWKRLRIGAAGEYWQRPGKDGTGISATWDVVPGHFYVFSSNAEPLRQGKAYDLFGLFAQLEADGDFRNATKLLVEQGYGKGDGLSRGGVNNEPGLTERQHQCIAKFQALEAEQWAASLVADDPEIQKPARFPLLPLSQVLSLPPTQWLVDELLMEQSFAQVYGCPGAAKSFLILDLALSIAYGSHSWFGRRIRRHGPVVWINADGGRGMSKRVQAWVEAKATARETQHPFLTLMGAVRLNRPEEMLPFRKQLARMEPRPVLVVVDTLSRCTPGADENSQMEMAATVGLCDLLREEAGCSLLLIHHTGRSGERDRGSSVIPGALDTQIRVSLDEYSKIGTVRCEKSRDGDRFRPFQFQLTQSGHSCIVTEPEDRRSSFKRLNPYE